MEISMKEVREEIDLIDRELVLLLARRQKCVEMAAAVKNDKDLITFGYINDPIKIIIEEFNGNQLTLKLSNKIILNYNTSTSSSISIVSNLLTWLFRL